MVETTTGWLEMYPMLHVTAQNTMLGIEKQALWQHSTPERIKSDNGTHFKNSLIKTWARDHGARPLSGCFTFHYVPPAGKVKQSNGVLKPTLKTMVDGTFKLWHLHLAKATRLVNTRGPINWTGPVINWTGLCAADGDKMHMMHVRAMLGKTVWINPASSKGKPSRGIVFVWGPWYTRWVIQRDREACHVPQGDLTLVENSL